MGGWYVLHGRVNCANTSAITYLQVYIVTNGYLTLTALMAERNTHTGGINANCACVHYLNAGDYVDLYSNAGGVSTFTINGVSGAFYNSFGMFRLSL